MTEQALSTKEQPLGIKNQSTDYPAIGILSFAHTLNDMYSNFLPALLPFLAISLGINATKAAIWFRFFQFPLPYPAFLRLLYG
jgi:hypothetical protein